METNTRRANRRRMNEMFNNILFDAKKLVSLITPAAWGQGFKDKNNDYIHGEGISLERVIECLCEAKRLPADNEGYVRSGDSVFFDLVRLTIKKKPLCSSPSALMETMGNTHEDKAHNFSSGERVLIKAIWDLKSNEDKFMFYILFHERIDPLIKKML
jgi:hypothetical protein